MLAERCRADLVRQLRGKSGTKAERLEEERSALLPLPVQECEARRVTHAGADSLSLVRFDTNSSSVPVKYAHRTITVVATVDEVRLVFEDRLIARHPRHWGRERYRFEPIHYLALLERKPGAFDYARPLAEWQLPDCFDALRRRLERTPDGLGTAAILGWASGGPFRRGGGTGGSRPICFPSAHGSTFEQEACGTLVPNEAIRTTVRGIETD
ncbi:MAG TPA: hypothetical protein VHZ24_18980 [Pirellulales bacterium]|nr:hypothetical protein [Pirellulales bacterium]